MFEEVKAKMDKAIAAMESDFAGIRAGRANPAVLDKISVDYYGTATPIAQVGTVSVPDPRMLMIQPWDASILKDIYEIKKGTKDEVLSKEFLNEFCRINNISIQELPVYEGALRVKK